MIDNRASSWIGVHSLWSWPAAAGVALIVVLLALCWLLALLFSTHRSGDLMFPEDRSAGRTILDAGALAEAVTQEIQSYCGVHAARARLIGDPANADLVVTVIPEETADLAALRQRIENLRPHPPPASPAISEALVTSRSTVPNTVGRSQPPDTSRWRCDHPAASAAAPTARIRSGVSSSTLPNYAPHRSGSATFRWSTVST